MFLWQKMKETLERTLGRLGRMNNISHEFSKKELPRKKI